MGRRRDDPASGPIHRGRGVLGGLALQDRTSMAEDRDNRSSGARSPSSQWRPPIRLAGHERSHPGQLRAPAAPAARHRLPHARLGGRRRRSGAGRLAALARDRPRGGGQYRGLAGLGDHAPGHRPPARGQGAAGGLRGHVAARAHPHRGGRAAHARADARARRSTVGGLPGGAGAPGARGARGLFAARDLRRRLRRGGRRAGQERGGLPPARAPRAHLAEGRARGAPDRGTRRPAAPAARLRRGGGARRPQQPEGGVGRGRAAHQRRWRQGAQLRCPSAGRAAHRTALHGHQPALRGPRALRAGLAQWRVGPAALHRWRARIGAGPAGGGGPHHGHPRAAQPRQVGGHRAGARPCAGGSGGDAIRPRRHLGATPRPHGRRLTSGALTPAGCPAPR